MDQLYIRTDVIMSLAASFPEFALGRAFYWKTDRVEPGRYYVGLWAETSDKRYRSEYSPIKLLSTLFQNGWPVRRYACRGTNALPCRPTAFMIRSIRYATRAM